MASPTPQPTPGPWRQHRQEREVELGGFRVVRAGDGPAIAYVAQYDDAALIAAAPALRDALRTSLTLRAFACDLQRIAERALTATDKVTLEILAAALEERYTEARAALAALSPTTPENPHA